MQLHCFCIYKCENCLCWERRSWEDDDCRLLRNTYKSRQECFCIDADINIHFAQNLGVSPVPEKALSYLPNKQTIREYLRGTNERIPGAQFFVKTTPPGQGSNLLRITPDDSFLHQYTNRLSDRLFVGYIGTYQPDEIGVSCYHGNLGIAEHHFSS